MITVEERMRALYGMGAGKGLLAGAAPRLPGLFGDPRDRIPNGVLSNPAAPPINVQPLAGPGVARALPTALDRIKGALGNGINTILSGANDPRLSPEQNAEAQKAARIRAGLAMMAASGQTAAPVNLAQILASGAMAGQQAGMEGRAGALEIAQQQAEAARKQNAQGQLQQVMAGGVDVPTMRRMLQEALASGDIESAKVLAQVIPSMETAGGRGAPSLERFTGPDGGVYTFDRATGQAQPVMGPDGKPMQAAAELDSQDLGDRVIWFPKGQPDRVVREVRKGRLPGAEGSGGGAYNPNTDPVLQRAIAAREMGLTQAPGSNTEQARFARALAPVMDDAATRIRSMTTPEFMEKITARPGLFGVGNYFNTPAGRQFRQASVQMLSSALSIISGKTVTEQEVERKEQELIPQPGDDKATVDAKLNAMNLYVTAAKQMGGATPAGRGSVSPPVTGGFDDLIPASAGAARKF